MRKFSVIFILLILVGCDTPPPKPVVEDPAAKAKAALDAIEIARQAPYSRYEECRLWAVRAFDHGLAVKGTPTPGKKGVYTEKVPGDFEKLQQQQNFDDTECRKVYEA